MSWETLNTIAQVTGVILIAITFGVGAFTVYSQLRVNKAQKEEIKQKDERLALELKEKDLQIAAADRKAAEANESAAELNERAQALERNNLLLRDDVNKASGEVASLQKEAANARAAQQRVETELARQRERTAIAERALLELQQRVQPRTLTAEQYAALFNSLRSSGTHSIALTRLGDQEAGNYADQFIKAFSEAGWQLSLFRVGTLSPPIYGIILRTQDRENSTVVALLTAFYRAGITVSVEENAQNQSVTRIIVGLKPQAP